MLTEQQISEMVKDSIPDIKAAIKIDIAEAIIKESRYAVSSQVSKIVAEWAEKELAPEVTRILIESKDGFIKAIGDFANQLNDELVKTLLGEAKKNLTQSYNRTKIIDALLK